MSLNPYKAIETTLGVNKTAAKIAIGGWIVVTLAISLKQYLDDDTVTFWQMLVALVALILLMMLLSELPRLVARGMVSFMCVLFAVWSTAGVTQVVTNNGLTFLGHYRCIFSLGFSEGCDVTPANASNQAQTRETVRAPAPETPAPGTAAPGAAAPGSLAPGSLAPGTLAPREEAIVIAPPPGMATRAPILGGTARAETDFVAPSAEVFLLYAGYDREQTGALATALLAAGWNVQGAERGGDRHDAARGLNEVRFFHPDDLEAARHLAGLVSASLPGRPGMALQDLSGTRHAQPAGTRFEVWISP